MTIAQLENAVNVHLDDLKDVTFTGVSRTSGVIIQVLIEDSVILNHRYFADPSGQVHLDLRDLVRDRTSFVLPDMEDEYTLQADSGIYLTVKQDTTEYGFYAFGFREGLRQKLSNIDYLRIPRDFRMILSLPNLANLLNVNEVTANVKYIDHVRTRFLNDLEIGEGEGYVLVKEFGADEILPVLHRPFQLEFSFQDVLPATQPKLMTPVYEVCPGNFEQYLFLTDRGSFENIPMDGNLKAVPEYSFENAKHPSGLVKVKDGMEEIFEQDSGYLTATAADELRRLLCSSDIYHLEDGTWKMILIENTSVSLGKQDTLRNVTFSWRHAQTD